MVCGAVTLVLTVSFLCVLIVDGKTQVGVLRTSDARSTNGQFITSFGFHGEAEIRYRLNTTGNGSPSFYLILDEDWPEAQDTDKCQRKLEMARVTHEIVNTSGVMKPAHFPRPRIWHIVYADSYACGSEEPLTATESPNYIQYTMYLLNPDSLGNPTNHFSDEETGLFRFYQLLALGYFILACIYGPRLYDSLKKDGPMHLVIQLLTGAMALQAASSLAIMLHLRGYSKDGLGSPLFELLSEFLDVLSQFVMLYMLLSLSLGWTLSGTVKPARSFKRLRAKPAAKVIAVVGVLQAVLFIWEQYEQREHRTYHAHRTYAGLALVSVRIVLAGLFAVNLHTTVRRERSALKREFYGTFTKSTMVWFLCYPCLMVCSWVLPIYLRFKFVTMCVVFCQSFAVLMLYRLFISRSLYWEISALSSTLPLCMDKSFGIKIYS